MEYIEGEDLSKSLTSEEDAGQHQAARPAAGGRAPLRHRDVPRARISASIKPEPFVHNDIKPENVIIDHNSDQAVLVDFGTAKGAIRCRNRRPGRTQRSRMSMARSAMPPRSMLSGRKRAQVRCLCSGRHDLLTCSPTTTRATIPSSGRRWSALPVGIASDPGARARRKRGRAAGRRTIPPPVGGLPRPKARARSSRSPFPAAIMATTVTGVLDLSLSHWEYARQHPVRRQPGRLAAPGGA